VSYRERLGTYLDGFPAAIANVTVHHLLTHTSGLGDYHGMPGYFEDVATWTTPEQTMAGTTDYIRRSELSFAPGAGWSYSNSGFHLLGEIVAKASGMSYYDYVRQHVFAAAGMGGADFVTKSRWRTDRRVAHPYHRDERGRWVDAIEEFGYIGTPAGEAFATCADLDRFARYLFQDRFLEHARTQLVLSGKVLMPEPTPPPGQSPPQGGTPVRENYQCYGPMGILLGDQWNFGHNGGNPAGIATAVEFYPETDWVVVVLCNTADAAVGPIVTRTRNLIVPA
jgi:CubicO group peptidase (beta-lactamase class C family)